MPPDSDSQVVGLACSHAPVGDSPDTTVWSFLIPYLPAGLPKLAPFFRQQDLHAPSSTSTEKACGHPIRNPGLILSLTHEPYTAGISCLEIRKPLVRVLRDFDFSSACQAAASRLRRTSRDHRIGRSSCWDRSREQYRPGETRSRASQSDDLRNWTGHSDLLKRSTQLKRNLAGEPFDKRITCPKAKTAELYETATHAELPNARTERPRAAPRRPRIQKKRSSLPVGRSSNFR